MGKFNYYFRIIIISWKLTEGQSMISERNQLPGKGALDVGTKSTKIHAGIII